MVDAYSKWLEVYTVNKSTSLVTIERFGKIFATDGILEVIMDQCSTVLSLVRQSRKLNFIGTTFIKVAGYTEPKPQFK